MTLSPASQAPSWKAGCDAGLAVTSGLAGATVRGDGAARKSYACPQLAAPKSFQAPATFSSAEEQSRLWGSVT